MEPFAFRSLVVRYVSERRCRRGGFCFYRLEEPNGSDTWHALSILDILKVPCEDEATVACLKRMQRPDGSYDSIHAAWYAIRSLALLDEIPSLDPRSFVLRNLERYRFDAKRLPAGVISMFKRTSYLVDLCVALNMGTDGPIRDNMVDFILGFRNEDGGFGHPASTLHDTARALAMLKSLGSSLGALGVERFIRLCEVPSCGFTDIPRTTLSCLEYVHAGVLASHLIARKPAHRDACAAFVTSCRNRTGGFSRSPLGGIATLENTWLGVHALTMLASWESCERT